MTAYKVYRGGTLVATLGNVTSYSDTGLTGSTTYSYTVAACDAAGNCSVASTAAVAITQAATVRTPPTATGTASGPIANQTIKITVTPPANVLGLSASVFVAAVLPPSMGSSIYLMSASGGWTLYSTCNSAPAALTVPLTAGLQIPVVSTAADLSTLKGTSVYVGYGFGATPGAACSDMINSLTFAPAYTIN